MEALKLVPYVVLILAVTGIIMGAVAVTLGEFQDSINQKCWNSSYTLNTSSNVVVPHCINATSGCPTLGAGGKESLNLSDAYYALYQSEDGIETISEQQPTVAIIGVMVIIISVIAGIFAYIKFFG